MKKSLFLLLPLVVFGAQLNGGGGVITSVPQTPTTTTTNNNTPTSNCIVSNVNQKSCILRIEATGVGIVPCNGACSTAQARAMARRAAIMDGYKSLTEKMYGIKINGRDTVKNMILQNSTIRGYVEGLIRGAQIEEESFKDGAYSVVMSLKLNVKEWNQYLKTQPAVETLYW